MTSSAVLEKGLIPGTSWVGSAILAAFLSASPSVLADESIPVEHFARRPAMDSVTLSPDGERLAYLMNRENVTILATYDLEEQEQHLIARTDNNERSFRWFSWANNDKLLVSILVRSSMKGVNIYKTRLANANWKGGELDILVKPREDLSRVSVGEVYDEDDEWSAQFQDRVITTLPDDPEHILLAADFEIVGRPTVYRININSKRRSEVMPPVADVSHWVGDDRGEWLAGTGRSDGVRSVYIRKIDDKATERKLWEYDITKEGGPYPLGFNRDPRRLIVAAPHEGRTAIYSVDFTNEELPMELLASDEQYDIGGHLIRSPATGNYVGAYYEGSSGRHVYWDQRRKALQAGIDNALPGVNRIVSFSRDEVRYVLRHSRASAPPVYLFGDREKKALNPIGSVYPELENATLPEREAVTLETRDGLELEGYLTVPVDSKKPLPAVVFPHGGPSGRDTGQFDAWAAFIASRGYAVLQVNFRGSTGYGSNFARRQMQKWGLELQDDITDSARWLIKREIADPERICIVGHSYGGYAALMGAVKTPDLFRCAVGSAGVYDLVDLAQHGSIFFEDEIINWQLGSKWFDRERLNDTSPVNQADKVDIPVLIVHGDEDRVVPAGQAHDMVDALEDADKDVQFVLQEGGDHYFRRYTQRLEFLDELDAFLAEHLGS